MINKSSESVVRKVWLGVNPSGALVVPVVGTINFLDFKLQLMMLFPLIHLF